MHITSRYLAISICAVLTLAPSSTFADSFGKRVYIDLSHKTATFQPTTPQGEACEDALATLVTIPAGIPLAPAILVVESSIRNIATPDLGAPNPESTGNILPAASVVFSENAVGGIGSLVVFDTEIVDPGALDPANGFVKVLTPHRIILDGNTGTSIDAPGHFQTLRGNEVAAAQGAPSSEFAAPGDARSASELGPADLIGKLILIDISERVAAELTKNGGEPDPSLTDFSEASGNSVTRADIDAIAHQLEAGAYVVAHTGWDRFFNDTARYLNGANFPGFSRGAIDRLIELENAKGIRINGLGADNRSVDNGESFALFVSGDQALASIPAHIRGLRRGWKMVEDLTNLQTVADSKAKRMTLIVAAAPLGGLTEAPARVFAELEGIKRPRHR